jgi:tetratricopeptide (TPR) repeat protein
VSGMFTKGNGQEVRRASNRALELAQALDDRVTELRQLIRLQVLLIRAGESQASLAASWRSEAVARELDTPVGIEAAHSSLAMCYHMMGDQAKARQHLELALSGRAGSAGSPKINLGFDHRNRARITLARTLFLLGYPEQARDVAHQAIEDAAALDDAVTLCVALVLSIAVFIWTDDLASAETYIDRLVTQAERHSLTPYHAVGLGERGTLLIRRGDLDAGMRCLRGALETLREYQYALYTGPFQGALAEGLWAAGLADEALAMVNDTIAVIEDNGIQIDLPELVRIKGTMLEVSDPDAALACYRRAIELAQQQSAPAWQLRAATDMAACLSRQGRPNEAHAVLAPVIAQFTEGLAYSDLRVALALAARLQAPG